MSAKMTACLSGGSLEQLATCNFLLSGDQVQGGLPLHVALQLQKEVHFSLLGRKVLCVLFSTSITLLVNNVTSLSHS